MNIKKAAVTMLSTLSLMGVMTVTGAVGPTNNANASSRAENSAKRWIAHRESTNSYHAVNGKYYGKYQLGRHLLKGNYSAANQEKTANQYVYQRYGSWQNAKAHWVKFNWY